MLAKKLPTTIKAQANHSMIIAAIIRKYKTDIIRREPGSHSRTVVSQKLFNKVGGDSTVIEL